MELQGQLYHIIQVSFLYLSMVNLALIVFFGVNSLLKLDKGYFFVAIALIVFFYFLQFTYMYLGFALP